MTNFAKECYMIHNVMNTTSKENIMKKRRTYSRAYILALKEGFY